MKKTTKTLVFGLVAIVAFVGLNLYGRYCVDLTNDLEVIDFTMFFLVVTAFFSLAGLVVILRRG